MDDVLRGVVVCTVMKFLCACVLALALSACDASYVETEDASPADANAECRNAYVNPCYTCGEPGQMCCWDYAHWEGDGGHPPEFCLSGTCVNDTCIGADGGK